MKSISYAGAVAGLVCCLASSPARADIAAPDPGAAASSGQLAAALQSLTAVVDAAAAVSGSSALAAGTASSGPTTAPATSLGVDSSNLPALTGTVAAASAAATAQSSGSVAALLAEASPAAAPAALAAGNLSYLVGTPPSPSTDLSSLTASATTPLSIVGSTTPLTDIPATPIPAAVLLLGSGLLGLAPLRRSKHMSAVA